MLTIRAATATDLPALAQLWHEKTVLQADPRVQLAPDARQQWAAAMSAHLQEPQIGMFVAEQDAALIGYVTGSLHPLPGLVPEYVGLISEIALDAHGYHGGVGRALVEALRDWFRAHGAAQAAVWLAHHDPVAQAFWRSLGASEWVDVLWMK